MAKSDIIAENITKSYDNKKVIDSFSHVFEKNSLTIVKGKSGSGKTTLLRIIMGLETYESGCLKGMDNRKISAVFQENRLCDNLTALLNVKMVTDNNNRHSDAEIVSCFHKIGIEDISNKPVSEFSGGMKRRVAILRALIADFDILIMDEPMKGLDRITKEKTINLIGELTREKTIIMTSHDESEKELFEKATKRKAFELNLDDRE